MSEPKLPACPFCGAPAQILPRLGGPECPYATCSAECYIGTLHIMAEDWNRRIPPPATRAYVDLFRRPFIGTIQEMAEQAGRLRVAMMAEWPEPAKEPAHE